MSKRLNFLNPETPASQAMPVVLTYLSETPIPDAADQALYVKSDGTVPFTSQETFSAGLKTDSISPNLASTISLNGATIVSATISMTSAQFKALHTTAKTLVAAPGAGLAIVPISTYIEYTYLTAAYVVGDPVQIDYGTSNPLFTFDQGCFTGGASGAIFGTALTPTGAYETLANKAIELRTASNPTTGGGSFKIYITYSLVTI